MLANQHEEVKSELETTTILAPAPGKMGRPIIDENQQRSRFVPPWAKKETTSPPSTEPKPLGELTNLELLYREMADRFPSIEDLDSGAQPSETPAGGSFLDRERAALGDDADIFTSGNEQTATVEDGDNDLLGGDFSEVQQPSAGADLDEVDGFESSFPAIDTRNENIGPGGSITNTSAPSYTNYTPSTTSTDDSPAIAAWRAKRTAELSHRDEASAKKKAETIATARKDIDAFYESYNRKTDKQKAQTANEAADFLAKREDTTAGGTSWERIAKLADLSGKGNTGGAPGSSKARMREMLVQLKGDQAAPGASGV